MKQYGQAILIVGLIVTVVAGLGLYLAMYNFSEQQIGKQDFCNTQGLPDHNESFFSENKIQCCNDITCEVFEYGS